MQLTAHVAGGAGGGAYAALDLREALAQIAIHLVALNELSQIAAALLDIVQQRADDFQPFLKLPDIEGFQQVRRTFEGNFAARGDEVPAVSAGDVYKLIANHRFGRDLGRGIVRDAGQPAALQSHGHLDDAVGLGGSGEGHRPHFADADAIHPHRRSRSQPGGVGNVEIHGGLLGQQRSSGQQVREYRENQHRCRADGKDAELSPVDLARGGHSIGLYRFQGHRANADVLRPLAMPQRATAIWRALRRVNSRAMA